ncbi:putative WRKY transcription factor 19 [Morella rubra]|uniref:Putative WRKY transcription factor 19 n=1 Tax=Morella rubra TaxID=262757 RepID=A0A6A1V157_9ROSI|nr:putative WRKY transcription factor 19 [Morella rubra]
MKNLRILKLNNIILPENLWGKLCATIGHKHPLESIPTKELCILKWDVYPLKSLPTNFQANNYVELSIHGRDIKELWKGTKGANSYFFTILQFISKDGRYIFDFLITGSSLVTSGISEWFNNTTTNYALATLQDRLRKREYCAYYFPSKERKSEISLEELEDLPMDVKDCKVWLVYEDDTSLFYNSIAPHDLHSQYLGQYTWETARDEEMDSDEHLDR